MKKLIIRTALAILLPVIIIAVVSCMKKPDHTADYGPEVDVASVNSALNALGESDPETIRLDEFRYYVIYQTIDQSSSPQIIFDIGRTVTAVSSDTNYVYVDYIDQIREFKPEGVVTSTDQAKGKMYQKLSAQGLTALASVKDQAEKIKVYSSAQMKPTSDGETRLSYHNLKEEGGYVLIPEGVRSSSDCGGLPSSICQCTAPGQCDGFLRVNKVSFDEVVWKEPNRGTKTSYSVIVAPDAPFFSQQISLCIQNWMDYGGRVIPITQCQEVKNFRFGTAAAPANP